MTLAIRQLAPADWATFRALRIAILTDSPSAFSSTLEQTLALTEPALRTMIANRAQFVAARGDDILGTAGAFPLHDGGVEVIGMWIAPHARRGGLAKALLDEVFAWSRAAGYSEICLWVTEGNEPAQALYRALGFADTGDRQLVRPDEPHVEVCMKRAL